MNKELESCSNEIRKLKAAEDIIINNLDWLICEDEDLMFNENILKKLSVSTDSPEKKIEAFIELGKKCKLKKDQIWQDYVNYRNEINKIDDSLKDINKVIASLNANILQFPSYIQKAKTTLQNEFDKLGIKTEVRIFAELVRGIHNEEWRAVIETYLGYRRYDFIIEEQYCVQAAQILKEQNIYGVRVVYTDKIPVTEEKEGSAAKQLDIPNLLARRYANYLLNNIHLCENMDELHEYSSGGITKDGMVAKGHTVSKSDLKKTEMCLGQGALEFQRNKAEKEKKTLLHKKNESERIYENLEKKLESLDKFNCDDSYYAFEAPLRSSELKEKIKEIDADINVYKNNPDFMTMLAEREKADLELKEAQNQLERIDKRYGSLDTQISKKEEERIRVQKEYDAAFTSYEKKKSAHIEIVYLAEEKYKKLSREKNKFIVVYDIAVRNLYDELHEIEKRLENEQLEYCSIRGIGNSRRGAGFIPWYRNEYAEVSNIKLEDAKNKMEEKERDLQSSFMHDFIGEIYDAMRVAKNEVNMINKELKRLPFGEDVYQFVMEERPERKIFFNIAKKITECKTIEMYSAINGSDEELENDIQDFMETILAEEDETEYTDYRKYYTFDMSMSRRIGEGVITANLSKKQGSASNGEKQTPYFIILAASLMQFYPKNTCCARIAFIDEAFSALSRERIEQMVKYFEEHNFQVIYAAPPEKMSSIGRFIDTSVLINAKDNYSFAIEGITLDENE